MIESQHWPFALKVISSPEEKGTATSKIGVVHVTSVEFLIWNYRGDAYCPVRAHWGIAEHVAEYVIRYESGKHTVSSSVRRFIIW